MMMELIFVEMCQLIYHFWQKIVNCKIHVIVKNMQSYEKEKSIEKNDGNMINVKIYFDRLCDEKFDVPFIIVSIILIMIVLRDQMLKKATLAQLKRKIEELEAELDGHKLIETEIIGNIGARLSDYLALKKIINLLPSWKKKWN